MYNYNFFEDLNRRNPYMNSRNYSAREIDNINNNMISDYNPRLALMRGNLFQNLYRPYTNKEPYELKPRNERDVLLFEIMEASFMEKELNLYLDMNPNDLEMIHLHLRYVLECKRLTEEYESKYGVITTDSKFLNEEPWGWIKGPWPWEGN